MQNWKVNSKYKGVKDYSFYNLVRREQYQSYKNECLDLGCVLVSEVK